MHGLIKSLLIFSIPILTIPQQSGLLLLFSIILDFATGILAGWIEIRKSKTSAQGEKYFIESTKFRLTAVKIGCYSMGVLGAWGIETIFFIQKIPSGYIATKDLTLTTFVIGFFCMIELYSIFFENVKRMGFDIIQKTKTISSEAWKFYKTIKNGPSDY